MGNRGTCVPNHRGTEEIYLDANATVRPLDCVVEAVTAAMRDAWGNPSSEHGAGTGARRCSFGHGVESVPSAGAGSFDRR